MHAAAQRRLYLGDRIALGGGDGLLLSLVDACLVFEVERVPRLLVQKVMRPSSAQDEIVRRSWAVHIAMNGRKAPLQRQICCGAHQAVPVPRGS